MAKLPWADRVLVRDLARRVRDAAADPVMGEFDEKAIKAYLRRTVEICKGYGCHLEMILKDTHTCQHHPERFDRWALLAQEAVAEVW